MGRYFLATITCLLLVVLCTVPAQPVGATGFALMIGVGAYPQFGNNHQLEGPANDVQALKEILTGTLGFTNDHMITLVDKEATRAEILRSLQQLIARTRSGDFVFIFFSGHGTSSYNVDTREWGLDPHTGALIPADFRISRNVGEMLQGLIIGKRDLRPLLYELEKNCRVLVVFDTCFSGNTVRGRQKVDAGAFLADKFMDSEIEKTTGSPHPLPYDPSRVAPPYPYDNVVYISASSEREKAQDITAKSIRAGMATFDGKPHGVLTNALLWSLSGSGDTNDDGRITYRELFQSMRDMVTARFSQTPQILYPEGKRKMLDQCVIAGGLNAHVTNRQLTSPDTPLRLKLDGLDARLSAQVSSLVGIRIVDCDFDLLIKQAYGAYFIILPSGYPLQNYGPEEFERLSKRLSRQVAIKKLVGMHFSDQPFNAFLDATSGQGVLVEGEPIGFKIQTEAPTYPLLLNIDPWGNISVLYPAAKGDVSPLPAGEELNLKDQGIVGAPYGTDTLRLFAFRNLPEQLHGMIKGEFPPDDPRFEVLLQMLETSKGNLAVARLTVTTCSQKDLVRSEP